MGQIIEVDEKGGLYLPPEVLGDEQPHTPYVLEARNGILTLTRLRTQLRQEPPFWATATPEERAKDFLEWALSHKDGPNLPDDALRRENMYD
jgi:hypothetical protein